MARRALHAAGRRGAGAGPAADHAVPGGPAARAHHPRRHLQRRRQRARRARPGSRCCWSPTSCPRRDKNPTATYLAQRTQVGSGNTPQGRRAAQPRRLDPDARARRHRRGQLAATSGRARRQTAGRAGADARSAWSTSVRYLADAGRRGHQRATSRCSCDQPQTRRAGARRATARRSCAGPQRDELWITPDTRAATLAPYLDAWRRKVERIGTLNYPTAAQRRRRGRATRWSRSASPPTASSTGVLIRRSSGHPELDQAALEILKLASPFDPVPAGAGARVPGAALRLRVAVRPAAGGRRHRIGSLRLPRAMPILGHERQARLRHCATPGRGGARPSPRVPAA